MRKTAALLAFILVWSAAPAAWAEDKLDWRPWSAAAFDAARPEKRMVLLDLEAVWCHWCHVMKATTYRDPEVVSLLAKHFVLVRADQDANPDLATRYGDWGWPATILFAADGSELAKLRGYKDPGQMASILKAFIAEPTPGPSVQAALTVIPAQSMFLSEAQRRELKLQFDESFDELNAGWGNLHKFIHTASMDYALMAAEAGDAQAASKARRTLDAALNLIDPVWGGMYQYSDQADWRSPHYEKIMWYQAQGLRQYAQAYRIFGDEKYLAAARNIAGYLTGRLRAPEGAFYVSQDADFSAEVSGKDFYGRDAVARAKLGEPRIDTNLYARENGWAIAALAAYSDATGDRQALAAAIAAAEWVVAHRALPGGGFAHGDKDRAGPYLGDTLAMTDAALALYASTGDRKWLAGAIASGDFIVKTFAGSSGFSTSATGEHGEGALAVPFVDADENMMAARVFDLLARVSGLQRFRVEAGNAMRYLASKAVMAQPRLQAGTLLANGRLALEPVHITVVGAKDDPAAQALHAAARAHAAPYKRVDWWDMREGPMINPDVQYPEMPQAAAFACSNQICSRPAFTAAELEAVVKQMAALRVVKDE